eukprot:TRINITY_DN3003_c0_g1_i1.p1 TRINITY_DN3003_c0_g1~~TRINITY_DN3003_c0_g1_i1.p1  ORF type:complete len:765 (+),score=272.14 TRINITY_DN3003_c0_g1_i1:165-2459(+)
MATAALQHDAEACKRFDPRPPEGWFVRQSTTRPGVFYYVNKAGDTAVERPAPMHAAHPVPRDPPVITGVWLGRDRLLDWHAKLQGRFTALVVGFYIRFRLEDSANGKAHYKAGRIRGVTDEWRIFVDLGKGPGHRGETTGIDCVSNSAFSPDELRTWVDGLEPTEVANIKNEIYQSESRLKMIEAELKNIPDIPKKKGDRKHHHHGQPSPGASPAGQPDEHVRWRGGPHTPSSKVGMNQQQLPGPHVMTPASPGTPPGAALQHGLPQGLGALGKLDKTNGVLPATPQNAKARSRSRSRSHSRSPPPQQSTYSYQHPANPRPARNPKSLLSPQVLLIDEKGDPKGMCNMSDVISRQTQVEPDTPTANGYGPNFDPFAQSEAGAEQDLLGTESTILRVRELEATEPSDETNRPIEATTVLHMIMEAAVDGGREFIYKRPREFGSAIINLCRAVRPVLEKEQMLLRLSSPLYVFGDIHGNFADLYTFMKNIIAFGELNYTAADLLFLGDYVDRGTCSMECIAFLLAYKLLSPGKINLLRGNHESPEVNGDVATYGTVSFRHQCLMVFGEELGTQVWTNVNNLFRYLSLAAIVDDRIFATHGGIPQYYGGPDLRLDIMDKMNFPRFEEVQSSNPDVDTRDYRQFVSDLLWSDPAEPSTQLNEHGFGTNPRGPGIKTFGKKAVDTFLQNFGFDYIIRAHQEKSNGLRISDNARVITIFSSSDYGGHQNGAGVLLVAKGKIRMAIKDPFAPQYARGGEVHLQQPRGRNIW